VEEMMEKMGKEQKVLIAQQMRVEYTKAIKRKQRVDRLWVEAIWGITAIIVAAAFGLTMSFVVEDRIKKYPQYGTGWVPKSQKQRDEEAKDRRYIGR